MPLVDQQFADTFIFSRSRAAAYVDATGSAAVAGVDVARFDHDGNGVALGLLVEGVPEFGQADRLRVRDGDWTQPGGTVLHVYLDEAGQERRSAWYAPTDPLGAASSCLAAKGRHQSIAYVPGYLKNRGGWVRWRRQTYALGAVILADDDVILGATALMPILEG